jgi:alpha-1,6-mannosyltransferase
VPGVRIVLVANLHHPTSGGLRTAVDRLALGYAHRGHAVAVVVPGARTDGDPADVAAGTVTRLTLAAPRVPGTGGYRVMDPWRVRRLLEQLHPDRIEVSDRTTLRGLGRWAAERDVPALVLAHERLDRLLTQWLLPPGAARRVADAANRRTVAGHDLVVCSTDFAAEEFARLGMPVAQVPLGVDLRTFAPDRFDVRLRAELLDRSDVLLVHCGRLSAEKHPQRSLDTLAELRRRGVRATLVVVGDGPLAARLQTGSVGLPVRWLGHVADRGRLAALLASADVALAPGPHETFGLAGLESLACGTPVVASASSALRELVAGGRHGAAVADDAGSFADGVQQVLALPVDERRRAARARAADFPWSAAVDRMLELLPAA